jgi:hypothetical protein
VNHLNLLHGRGVLGVPFQQTQFGLGLLQFSFQPQELLGVVEFNFSREFVDAIDFGVLVMEEEFPEDLIFPFCCVYLFPEFGVVSHKAVGLVGLEFGEMLLVVDVVKLFPLRKLLLTLLLYLLLLVQLLLGLELELFCLGQSLLWT